MAWNMAALEALGPTAHLGRFLSREFGTGVADELLPVMNEHYRLAYIRKPEFVGNIRVEEWGKDYSFSPKGYE